MDLHPAITSTSLELQPLPVQESQARHEAQSMQIQNEIFQDKNVPQELNLEAQTSVQHTFPEGGLAAWLVVLGSAAMIGVTFGLASSVGIFQE